MKAVIGLPLIMNYYTVLDLERELIAFVPATYSITSSGLTTGAAIFLVEVAIIIICGIIGCAIVYKRNKKERLIEELSNERDIYHSQQIKSTE